MYQSLFALKDFVTPRCSKIKIPFSSTSMLLFKLFISVQDEQPKDKCNPTPCGPNALCDDGICSCLPEFHGDPYSGCRPECILNSECPRDKACLRNKCVNPCPGTCGSNAICNVNNHIPICTCPPGTEGNAFIQCRQVQPISVSNPCSPSPCGPNSQCKQINDRAVCSCVSGFVGTPPTCHPECVVNSDCPSDQTCSNQRCGDPCPGACGINAKCTAVNHSPICSCSPRFTGNPFVHCHAISKNNFKFACLIFFLRTLTLNLPQTIVHLI